MHREEGTIRNIAVSNSTMFPDFNFVDGLVILVLGFFLCFKRVAEMEGYHHLRVIVLTSLFGIIVVLFLIGLGSTFDDDLQYDCLPEHFCQTEM